MQLLLRSLFSLSLLLVGSVHAEKAILDTVINGKRVVTAYENGVKSGPELHYYDTGELAFEVEFIDNIQQGVERHYYQNGQRRGEIAFQDGVKHGDMFSWYESGWYSNSS